MRSPLLGLALLLAVATTLLATSASNAVATPSTDAVDAVNALRAMVGVAAIVNDESLAGDCALHAAWMQSNRIASHGEPAGSEGYTAAGDDAGRHSVLHLHTGLAPITSIDTIPWLAHAPLHLAQLLHPGLVRSGYAIDGDAACMWSLDSSRRPSLDVFDPSRGRNAFHTYPNARTGRVAPAQDTSEESPNPNELLGWKRPRVTGPYVLVFANGFGNRDGCGAIRVTSVKLSGADGSTPSVRWWDDARTIAANHLSANQCPIPAGTAWFAAGRPLATGTSYAATIRLVGAHAPKGTRAVTRTVKFTTTGIDRARPRVRVTSMTARHLAGGRFSWNVAARVWDASHTTCSATVQAVRVPCAVRNGRITLRGQRVGAPAVVSVGIAVRDAQQLQRQLRVSRRAT